MIMFSILFLPVSLDYVIEGGVAAALFGSAAPAHAVRSGGSVFFMLTASTATLMKLSSRDLASFWHSALSPCFCTSRASLKN